MPDLAVVAPRLRLGTAVYTSTDPDAPALVALRVTGDLSQATFLISAAAAAALAAELLARSAEIAPPPPRASGGYL